MFPHQAGTVVHQSPLSRSQMAWENARIHTPAPVVKRILCCSLADAKCPGHKRLALLNSGMVYKLTILQRYLYQHLWPEQLNLEVLDV